MWCEEGERSGRRDRDARQGRRGDSEKNEEWTGRRDFLYLFIYLFIYVFIYSFIDKPLTDCDHQADFSYVVSLCTFEGFMNFSFYYR